MHEPKNELNYIPEISGSFPSPPPPNGILAPQLIFDFIYLEVLILINPLKMKGAMSVS